MDKFLTKYNAELLRAIFKELQLGNKKNVKALVFQLKNNNKIIYLDMSK